MTNNVIVWVTASSDHAANNQIDECLRYVLRQIEGINNFKKPDVRKAKQAVNELVTAVAIPDRDTGKEVHVTVTRNDGTDRNGKKPSKFAWDSTGPDGNCSAIVIPAGKDVPSEQIT
ncbi:hypothetical protein [Halostagnicola bangensis]